MSAKKVCTGPVRARGAAAVTTFGYLFARAYVYMDGDGSTRPLTPAETIAYKCELAWATGFMNDYNRRPGRPKSREDKELDAEQQRLADELVALVGHDEAHRLREWAERNFRRIRRADESTTGAA